MIDRSVHTDDKPIEQLGRLQQSILETVWELGDATVHEIHDRLSQRRPLAYTTVLTGLQRLEKAGLVRHRRRGKYHVYRATRTRQQAMTHSVRRLIASVFGGDAALTLQHLVEDESLTDKELTELQKAIDKERKEREMSHDLTPACVLICIESARRRPAIPSARTRGRAGRR